MISIPKPLATHAGSVGRIGDVPGAGLKVLEAFEAPHVAPLHDLPQLTATLAAALQRSTAGQPAGSQDSNSLLRRAVRKVGR